MSGLIGTVTEETPAQRAAQMLQAAQARVDAAEARLAAATRLLDTAHWLIVIGSPAEGVLWQTLRARIEAWQREGKARGGDGTCWYCRNGKRPCGACGKS